MFGSIAFCSCGRCFTLCRSLLLCRVNLGSVETGNALRISLTLTLSLLQQDRVLLTGSRKGVCRDDAHHNHKDCQAPSGFFKYVGRLTDTHDLVG